MYLHKLQLLCFIIYNKFVYFHMHLFLLCNPPPIKCLQRVPQYTNPGNNCKSCWQHNLMLNNWVPILIFLQIRYKTPGTKVATALLRSWLTSIVTITRTSYTKSSAAGAIYECAATIACTSTLLVAYGLPLLLLVKLLVLVLADVFSSNIPYFFPQPAENTLIRLR